VIWSLLVVVYLKQHSFDRDQEIGALLEFGFIAPVAERLHEIFNTMNNGCMEYLDSRALEALKSCNVEDALSSLEKFSSIDISYITNKSAYLCGIIRSLRRSPRTKNVHTPNDDKIKSILQRTGYSLDISTGQRKYEGPPPESSDEKSRDGCEIFCGGIPKSVFEDKLIPIFETCGRIWDFRLMIDPVTGLNRGFAFVTYSSKEEATKAVEKLDAYELSPGKNLQVNFASGNTRLFVGNIPKNKSKEVISEVFGRLTMGLKDVIVYTSHDDKRKNRGFCFLDYESHRAASLAKRKLAVGRIKLWRCDIIVDWADPQDEPSEETMSKIKVLYCRNLPSLLTEEKLMEIFVQFGDIERVKKIKDYAFIHFVDREHTVAALNSDLKTYLGPTAEVSIAKPPLDKKKKEVILRRREHRMMMAMAASIRQPQFPAQGSGGWYYDPNYFYGDEWKQIRYSPSSRCGEGNRRGRHVYNDITRQVGMN